MTRDVVTRMQRAWNTGNGEEWAAGFAADADFVDALGRIQRGREVIGLEHQKLFDTIYRDSTVEMSILDERRVRDGITVVRLASTLRVPAGPRQGEWPAVITLVIDGGEIVAFHNTMRTEVTAFAEGDTDFADRSPLDWHPYT